MRRLPSIALVALSLATVLSTAARAAVPPLYKDPSLPVATRVEDLLSRLTPDEKILLLGGTGFTTQAIPRLDVPAFVMSDGPVGLRNAGATTAYPAGIALAASFDTDNALAIGTALGRDARSRGVHILLGPAMNPYRSPLTGRNFEYLGEDPVLAGTLAAGYVNGVQALHVAATIKHFAGNEQEFDRHNIDSVIDERTLRELYLRPFQICLELSHPWCVMTSYNPLNGIHASENKWLITDVLKDQWHFPGFVMSDWDSCYNTLGMANGGLDLEMPTAIWFTKEKLQPLLDSKQIEQSTIDDKVRRIFTVAFSMGWFDHPQLDPTIQADDPQNNQTALAAALDSITLLKNDQQFLPLDREKIKNIVLVGPTADPAVVSGGGSAQLTAFHPVSIYQGLRKAAGDKITVTRIPWTPPGLGHEMTHMVPSSKTWKAEFFTNQDLTGDPALTRNDNFIDYNWPRRPPAKGIPHDHFSARWTGTIRVDKSGPTIFACSGDDGFRVLLDGKPILDDWSSHAALEKNVTIPLEAGKDYSVVVEYFNGVLGAEIHFGWGAPRELLSADDAATLKSADLVLACVGFNDKTGASVAYEGEGSDRPYSLPANQLELLNRALALNPHTAVILTAGGAVDTTDWLDKTPALLDTYYPGSNGGTAVAEILFGDTNPSGKLPFTWEHTLADYPATPNYPSKATGRINTYTETLFTGYRRLHLQDHPPLFSFGDGLSYTTFEVSTPSTPQLTGDQITLTVPIKNTGSRPGSEVLQLYISPPKGSLPRPDIELKTFTKVSLAPNESKTITLSFPSSSLAYWNPDTKSWTRTPGTYTLYTATASTKLGPGVTMTLP
jgi:beta-glucosidase